MMNDAGYPKKQILLPWGKHTKNVENPEENELHTLGYPHLGLLTRGQQLVFNHSQTVFRVLNLFK